MIVYTSGTTGKPAQVPGVQPVGEEVLAAVIVRAGRTLEATELIAYCRERMAAYKYPRLVDFRTELPKNSLGKVLKDELAASWTGAGVTASPGRPAARPRRPLVTAAFLGWNWERRFREQAPGGLRTRIPCSPGTTPS